MPVEQRRAITERRQHRITPSGLRRGHPLPAEFDRQAEPVLGATGTGDDLRPEADAEHRFVGVAEGPREFEQGRKIRIAGIIEGVLAAPQQDHGIMGRGVGRQRIAAIGPAQIDRRPGGIEFGLHQAKRRIAKVFDGENVHEVDFGPIGFTGLDHQSA